MILLLGRYKGVSWFNCSSPTPASSASCRAAPTSKRNQHRVPSALISNEILILSYASTHSCDPTKQEKKGSAGVKREERGVDLHRPTKPTTDLHASPCAMAMTHNDQNSPRHFFQCFQLLWSIVERKTHRGLASPLRRAARLSTTHPSSIAHQSDP